MATIKKLFEDKKAEPEKEEVPKVQSSITTKYSSQIISVLKKVHNRMFINADHEIPIIEKILIKKAEDIDIEPLELLKKAEKWIDRLPNLSLNQAISFASKEKPKKKLLKRRK